jgi:NADH-quinone oxidoreductase subunit E|tara:strand:+ start:98 stop:544 length:447 start_codon:yes stop_codon:yes gene_type:complete
MEECLRAILSSHEKEKAELIPILQEVQEEYGYLPRETMLEIARFTRVPEGRVFGVASFYAQFRFTPVGRNIVRVCRGTACHVRGAPKILQEMENQLGIKVDETTPGLEYTLETVACIGACCLAPVVKVGAEVHGKLRSSEVAKMLKGL